MEGVKPLLRSECKKQKVFARKVKKKKGKDMKFVHSLEITRHRIGSVRWSLSAIKIDINEVKDTPFVGKQVCAKLTTSTYAHRRDARV